MAIALSLAFTATPVPISTVYVIEATKQVSAGISFVPRSGYKKVAQVAAAGASPANILAAYNALFGALISGKKIFFRMRAISSSGFASNTFQTSVIVT